MPYRAILTTLITVALALLAIGMWVSSVEPMLATALAATRPAERVDPPIVPATTPETASSSPKPLPPPDVELRRVIKGTLLLSFLLICMLLLVGLFASFREWVRFSTADHSERRKKTPYVDAWKIAGERMTVEKQKPGDSDTGEKP